MATARSSRFAADASTSRTRFLFVRSELEFESDPAGKEAVIILSPLGLNQKSVDTWKRLSIDFSIAKAQCVCWCVFEVKS